MSRSPEDDTRQSAHVSLYDVYHSYFEVIPATTPELLAQAHALRYQVYCVENEFEAPEDNPSGLETDEFDHRSCHSLLVHRASGLVAGTVRLILPDHGATLADLPAVSISDTLNDYGRQNLPTETTAEISRFSISKEFRRRIEDGRWPAVYESQSGANGANRRILPHITLGLMRAILQMSVENNVTHWCASVEPPLLRLLKRLGIHFHSVGPLVNYHGWRQPVHNSVEELVDAIYDVRPEVWEIITAKGTLRPAPECTKNETLKLAL